MTRPSTLPEWATAGERATISSGERATGFAYGQVVPFDLINAQLGELGDWVVYLDETATDHETRVAALEDDAVLAADALAVSDIDTNRAYVLSQLTGHAPGLVVAGTQKTIASSSVIDIACDGEWVWVAYVTGSNYFVRRYSRSTLTIDTTWTLTTGTTAIQCIACAGGNLLIGRTTDVVLANRDNSATTLVVLAAGGTVNDLATNGSAVWAAVGNFVKRTTVLLGSFTWSYDHGASVRKVCAMPVRTASGATETEVAFVGDVGSSDGSTTWGGVLLNNDGTVAGRILDQAAEASGLRGVACNGRRVYVSSQGFVYAFHLAGFVSGPEQAWVRQVSANNLNEIVATDTDVLCVDTTDNAIYVLAQSDGAPQWAYAPSAAMAINRVGCDVAGIALAGTSSGTYQLQRMTDGHTPRLIAKATATDTGRRPYHQLLLPIGGIQ